MHDIGVAKLHNYGKNWATMVKYLNMFYYPADIMKVGATSGKCVSSFPNAYQLSRDFCFHSQGPLQLIQSVTTRWSKLHLT